MMDMSSVSLVFSDLWSAIAATDLDDLALPTFCAMWMLLLLIPLHRVDRRDGLCAWMYSLYASFAGLVLVIILPDYLAKTLDLSLTQELIAFLFFAVLPFVRWYYYSNPDKYVVVSKEQQEDS